MQMEYGPPTSRNVQQVPPSQHSSLEAQLPADSWNARVNGTQQIPPLQGMPSGQAVLQLPQWFSSLSRFLHLLPHSFRPDLQRHLPRFPPLQRAPSQQSLFLSHFLPTFLQARADSGPPRAGRSVAAPVCSRSQAHDAAKPSV